MKRAFFSIFALAACLSACNKSGIDPNEVMGQAAKVYYEYLIHGKYEAYVDGFYQPDSIPDSYREQLVANAKMFAALMDEQHKGLKSVSVASAKADTARHVGHAFLILCFGDSTREEVVVPTVEHKGAWMLR